MKVTVIGKHHTLVLQLGLIPDFHTNTPSALTSDLSKNL